jgi:ABC-type transport system involved in cytochrome c biogenesis permease component
VASWIVPRTWQDRALTAEETRRRERLNRLKLGSSEQRRGFRQRLLEINPFYWLVARNRTKSFFVWGFLGAVGLIWMLGLIFNPHDWKQDEAYIFTAAAVHTVLKFWVVTEACRRFSLDRQSGALELLLSTPISVRAIVRGQWQGLERQFAGPVMAVLLVDLVFLLTGRHNSDLVITWIAGMVMLLADVVTLGWLGMWRGLNSRRPNRAAAAALVRVLVLPWMIFFLLITFAAMTEVVRRGFGRWNGEVLIMLWAAIGLGIDAVFGLPARQRLLMRFREVATQRFETRGQKTK